LLALLAAPLAAETLPDAERYDGTFRLDDGHVVTGGRFVEGGFTMFLYIDTDRPDFGGVFRRIGSSDRFEALPLGPGAETAPALEIEFYRDADGYDRLEWRAEGEPVRRGARILPHRSETVGFASADGTELEGRLLLPPCPGPHPLVVSVHGSGPVNRYGGTYHLFFVRLGMAVLAYDKRGYTADDSAWREPDIDEMAQDAAAAVEFGAARRDIDGDRIGLFGSSQGGWVAPEAAALAPATDFLLLRAGAALTQLDTVMHEIRMELPHDELDRAGANNAMMLYRELYRLAQAGRPKSEADLLTGPYRDFGWYRSVFGDEPISAAWSDRWWSWAGRNLAETPLPELRRSALPILWQLGERDEAVPFVATREALLRAFAESPGRDQTVQVIADAPHSFIVEGEEGKPVLSPQFFGGLKSWLEQRGLTGPSADCTPGARR